jgi:hypothetical protein
MSGTVNRVALPIDTAGREAHLSTTFLPAEVGKTPRCNEHPPAHLRHPTLRLRTAKQNAQQSLPSALQRLFLFAP